MNLGEQSVPTTPYKNYLMMHLSKADLATINFIRPNQNQNGPKLFLKDTSAICHLSIKFRRPINFIKPKPYLIEPNLFIKDTSVTCHLLMKRTRLKKTMKVNKRKRKTLKSDKLFRRLN
jgi:hypothetical protein